MAALAAVTSLDSPRAAARALAFALGAQALLVSALVAWAEKLGCLIGVSPLIMGATVIGASCSAPTFGQSVHPLMCSALPPIHLRVHQSVTHLIHVLPSVASTQLARGSPPGEVPTFFDLEARRRGVDLAAAFSNALGSNVFNCLVALGLPWLLANLLAAASYPPMQHSSSGAGRGRGFSSLDFSPESSTSSSSAASPSSSSPAASSSLTDPLTAPPGRSDDLTFALGLLLSPWLLLEESGLTS